MALDEVTNDATTNLVAAIMTNTELAPIVFECWDRGDAVLPLNPALRSSELSQLLELARPTHIIDRDGIRRLANGIPVDADTAAVVCTSGTTGHPKAVELTRSGLFAMGTGVSTAINATADDRWLACHPLFFVAGLAILGRSWVTGVPVTVHDGFDLDRVKQAPSAEGATIISVVPTTLRRMVSADALQGFRAAVVGGAPLPDAQRANAVSTGVTIFDAYGLTETWGGAVTNGVANEGVDMMLRSDGQVALRGAPIFPRYRNNPELTRAAFDDDWFLTGDVGRIVDGKLSIVDRIKDLIITGGVNVGPTEVEAILAMHSSVADVCVIGVPDEEWGERVVACVVATDPTNPPTLDELRGFVRQYLTAPKAPKELRIIREIPRSPAGKPLRRILAAE